MSAETSSPIIDDRPDRTTLVAFSSIVLIGGLNFVSVKFSNAELPPLFGAAVRFTAATLLFLVIARARKLSLPGGRALVGAAVYGILGFGVAYAFLYFALTRLQVGVTSVIMALVPLLTLIFAVLHGQERFSLRGVLGGLLALAGITMLPFVHWGARLPRCTCLPSSSQPAPRPKPACSSRASPAPTR